jgi:hypothetical protein
MGTNFYAIKQLPNSIKGKICELIETDQYDEAKKLFDDNYEKIHIGKSSFGWKFIFDYNHFKYYDLNRKSINDFLCRNDVKLYDEYGEQVSIDDFWRLVDSKKDGYDNISYYKDSDTLPFLLFEELIPDDLKEYKVEAYEFYSDDLRFASTTDFS